MLPSEHRRFYTSNVLSEYAFRLFSPQQMDFATARTQLTDIILFRPSHLYKSVQLSRSVKGYYHTDDPAVKVLQASLLLLVTILYVVVYGYIQGYSTVTALQAIRNTFGVVLIEYLALNLLLAAALNLIVNKFMRNERLAHSSDAHITYAYSVDVMMNAFTAILFLLVTAQLCLTPILLIRDPTVHSYTVNLVYTAAGNTLYAVAVGYAIYVVFLGCALLKSVESPERILKYSYALLAIAYIASIAMNINLMTAVTGRYWQIGSEYETVSADAQGKT